MDGWIEWKGGDRPVDGEVEVEVKFANGETWVDYAEYWDWSEKGDCEIVAYRAVSA